MATQVPGGGEQRVLIHFADDEIAEGTTSGLDLDRPEFDFWFDGHGSNSREAIVPLASVKRVRVACSQVSGPLASDDLRKVAVHFWDGEVMKGLLASAPHRHRFAMSVDLVDIERLRCETWALPYHAVKAVFFLRTWDTRPPEFDVREGRRRAVLPRHEAPLIDLLSEIRGLRGLRHRGQISAVEYERRRGQVLERI